MGLDSSLSEQETNSWNHGQAVSDVNSASETLERSEQFAATFKQNGLDNLHDYAVSNGKMMDTEFDQLTIAANRAGSAGAEAMQYLTTLAIDGVMMDGLDPEFSAVQDDIFNGGKSDINSDYANNFGNVQGVNQLWNDDVAARQAITAPAAKAIIANNKNYIKGVFSDPATARTPNMTVDGIQSDLANILAEGEATSNRVDDMRVLSDVAPGVAGVAGERAREREIEESYKGSIAGEIGPNLACCSARIES